MALVLLQLEAGAVDQHQVEVRVVDRVLHQFVVLVDHSKDRQGSVHRREFLDGSGLTPPRPGWQLERMTSEGILVLWMTYKAGPRAELDLAGLILLSRFLVKLTERFPIRL